MKSLFFLILCLATASAQDSRHDSKQAHPMPGMDHDQMDMRSTSLIETIEQHVSDGTSVESNSSPLTMLMAQRGKWMLMLHGNGFLNVEQQTGPRGGGKVFSTNWLMPMAQHGLGGSGTLTLRAMLSLEPATITNRLYPELFQNGETAFHRPIVDGQHPHDLFMELAALYDRKIGDQTLISLYAAPMGDPALGPTAYPHRLSASENPIATLGHHQQDSTHIAADVITFGITHRMFRIETSGFHGRELDENRWDIDSGPLDSWAGRLTINPTQNWSFQYSLGNLHSPEELHPDEDLRRNTASLIYNRPFKSGNWASTLLWGRNRSLHNGQVFNGYLGESTLRFARRNYLWTRIENTDRSDELLFANGRVPAGFEEKPLARVQAYTLGYDHDFKVLAHVATALGVQVTWYGLPDSLKRLYGSRPEGVVVFLRLRPFGKER